MNAIAYNERRAAHLRQMKLSHAGLTTTPAGWAYDALLDYFDDNEPALADALRYGLVPEVECRGRRKDHHCLCVNYPDEDEA